MKRENGFTLVELAIALMVIGLLIGGVLKGQELIKNAENLRFVHDLNSYNTAVAIFHSTYEGVPGDIRNPGSRLPNCTTTPCNKTETSNGDDLIGSGVGGSSRLADIPRVSSGGAPYNHENGKFWLHLEAAGLITALKPFAEQHGQVISLMESHVRGAYYHTRYYQTAMVGDPISPENYMIILTNGLGDYALTAATAEYIDSKTDDGKPFSGSVRMLGQYNYGNGGIISTNCIASGETTYNITTKAKSCNLAYRLTY